MTASADSRLAMRVNERPLYLGSRSIRRAESTGRSGSHTVDCEFAKLGLRMQPAWGSDRPAADQR